MTTESGHLEAASSSSSSSLEHIYREFGRFLDGAKEFYEALFSKLENIRQRRSSAHKCLIFLGDIARYAKVHSSDGASSTTCHEAESYYKRALQLVPEEGNAHNQLAVLATYRNADLVAAYHYVRAIYCERPFETARANLRTMFLNILKKNVSNVEKRTTTLQRFLQRFLRLHATLNLRGSGGEEEKNFPARLRKLQDATTPARLVATHKRLRRRFAELLASLNSVARERWRQRRAIERNVDLGDLDSTSDAMTTTTTRDATTVAGLASSLMTLCAFSQHECDLRFENVSFAERPTCERLRAHATALAFDFAAQIAQSVADADAKTIPPAPPEVDVGKNGTTKEKDASTTKKDENIGEKSRRRLLQATRLFCEWLKSDPSRLRPKGPTCTLPTSSSPSSSSNKDDADVARLLIECQNRWWNAICSAFNRIVRSTSTSFSKPTVGSKTTNNRGVVRFESIEAAAKDESTESTRKDENVADTGIEWEYVGFTLTTRAFTDNADADNYSNEAAKWRSENEKSASPRPLNSSSLDLSEEHPPAVFFTGEQRDEEIRRAIARTISKLRSPCRDIARFVLHVVENSSVPCLYLISDSSDGVAKLVTKLPFEARTAVVASSVQRQQKMTTLATASTPTLPAPVRAASPVDLTITEYADVPLPHVASSIEERDEDAGSGNCNDDDDDLATSNANELPSSISSLSTISVLSGAPPVAPLLSPANILSPSKTAISTDAHHRNGRRRVEIDNDAGDASRSSTISMEQCGSPAILMQIKPGGSDESTTLTSSCVAVSTGAANASCSKSREKRQEPGFCITEAPIAMSDVDKTTALKIASSTSKKREREMKKKKKKKKKNTVAREKKRKRAPLEGRIKSTSGVDSVVREKKRAKVDTTTFGDLVKEARMQLKARRKTLRFVRLALESDTCSLLLRAAHVNAKAAVKSARRTLRALRKSKRIPEGHTGSSVAKATRGAAG